MAYQQERRQSHGTETEGDHYDPGLATRLYAIRGSLNEYIRVMRQTGFEGHEKTAETRRWVERTAPTLDKNNANNILSREEFFSGHAKDMMRSALSLHANFVRPLERAYEKKLINKASRDRWMDRYYDKSSGFKTKEYWVNNQSRTDA